MIVYIIYLVQSQVTPSQQSSNLSVDFPRVARLFGNFWGLRRGEFLSKSSVIVGRCLEKIMAELMVQLSTSMIDR